MIYFWLLLACKSQSSFRLGAVIAHSHYDGPGIDFVCLSSASLLWLDDELLLADI